MPQPTPFQVFLASFVLAITCATQVSSAAEIDFVKQVRPILSDRCFRCHGPDSGTREAGLRLDERKSAITALDSGETAIIPGKPDESELIKRLLATDHDVVMPPPETGKKVSAAEVATLRQWIAEGANFAAHWSFVPPVKSAVPVTKNRDWSRGVIDQFVLARLEKEGLVPEAEADRAALIRRVTLDLTGLPPTPSEVDAFTSDSRPDAFERVVDRLLSSPAYGERMAVDWLDAARFADTHGFHIDSGRDMTRWREYVIDAFATNLPYDVFTREQLAGDLLPKSDDEKVTHRQLVASGFNRNHMINFEGGAIPAEYHNAYIVDRVSTTSTVFLGLTVACAQCHDHKYDPISHREFYQLYAFFNNVPENGLDGSRGNAAPLLKSPSRIQQVMQESMKSKIAATEKRIAEELAKAIPAGSSLEKVLIEQGATKFTILEGAKASSRGKATFEKLDDGSLRVGGPNAATEIYTIDLDTSSLVSRDMQQQLSALRVEALPDSALQGSGPGRSVNGNIVLTDIELHLLDDAGSPVERLAIATATADFSQETFPASNTIDDNLTTGWAIHPQVGKEHQLTLELVRPIAAKRVRLVLKFESQFAQHQLGRFRVSGTGASYPQLTAEHIAALSKPAPARNQEDATLIHSLMEKLAVSPELRSLQADLQKQKSELAAIDQAIPTTMVMAEMPSPRDTFIKLRGAYDANGEKVTAEVPAALPPLGSDQPRNRLGLANWLTDAQHPLLARVTVNRFWQMFFGIGLVKTSEDFGSQGELPSHPELLDYLAVDFVGADRATERWDVKRLVKQIVLSSTYRQSSRVTPEKLARDPENRLLARGSRFRLQAEFLRDSSLYLSGLLDSNIGGKSVSPYQPAGIWEELASRADGDNWTAQKYKQDHGQDLYRRTMYTFWKRTAPPPTLVTFDAPDRETCTVRRARTNTPLQALVMLNDPTYVEASRQFAARLLSDPSLKNDGERLRLAVKMVTARQAKPLELSILQSVIDYQRSHYAKHADQATKLLAVGESKSPEGLEASELAAWTILCSTLLNTDEAMNR
ncbi:protein of unknown function DUF1549 [Pirellula staleyi DSM 6068]|uniref:Cytochrome c domain-containing protein n=1 Tax=Pirellula staleyi (strain ATCC 27377 / DSM 6068 / ICPB 4128) TaxID=530564 RepID=D2R2Q9_PIRSD|nr:PSD1 and planctomycete cytochrome C domain-containing protein [Pirellula staleyi]ADB16899.1 protein of unknown function DUF1549 [Pirellula staleyi DSM 6068]